MSLFFCKTWEQALLAMVVSEAYSTIQTKGEFLGRTAMQKIVYFLKTLGVPMRYRFDIYHYGPFCQEILMDMDWLIADGVVRDASENTDKYSNYAPDSSLKKLLLEHEDLEEHRDLVKKVANVLAPLRPEYLELIATLHYLFRKLQAARSQAADRDSVVNEFMGIKEDRFPRDKVVETFNRMEEAGFFG
jgi:uncharacterized protein YwgA